MRLFDRERLLLVARLEAACFRQHPDLQEVHLVVCRRVELAVGDTCPGRHALDVTGTNDGARSEAVLVGEPTFEDVGDDLHVVVRMRAEATAALDLILIDDAQLSEAHVLRVVVMAERERVLAVEPAEVAGAAIRAFANSDHGLFLTISGRARCLSRRSRSKMSLVPKNQNIGNLK